MSEGQRKNACRIARDVKYTGRWLQVANVKYRAHDGKEHFWECADRVASDGAVVIIPLIKSRNEVIIVRQYRPPTDKFIIEFPAGLIDAGETAAMTAERELLEETGYHGKVSAVSNDTYNSPGMSGEQTQIAIVEIDEAYHLENPPVAQPEGTEDIETFKVAIDDLMEFIQRSEADGDGIDSKVLAFAIAAGGLNNV